ncbi:major facilitator superfamily domain-containing protein [Suillus subaureus]|uniref:Major facilitator superfamily domain-containing protein n=1 Tax=Suillus subaureus TaxID=48587 RepID=A0A9P7E8J2_9AGAM|nr:major facilitator superfamily domain-containing protein [Suillus subaureus]KAG1814356.1 major facilitator superfamily domain-containing protein [Suillus subaureus]
MPATNQIPASVTDEAQDSVSLVSPAPTLQGDHTPNSVHQIPVRSHSQKSYNNELLPTTDDTGVLIVDWDGPDDPQNPKNWSLRRKWAATIILSSFTFISPVSSSMIVPATSEVASTFKINDDAILALTTSIFVLAYDRLICEIYGRSRVLQLANLWYLGILIFNYKVLFLTDLPLQIGGGFLGDCWQPDERGQAVAIYSLAPLLGPVLEPITGAWLFWSTSILGVTIQILGVFSIRESGCRTREIRTVFDNQDRCWRTIMAKSLSRPFALFVHEPIVQLLGVYMAYQYGLLYLFLTTIPSIFRGVYQRPIAIAGLHYIALGIGMIVAARINAKTMDKIYIHFKSKNGGVAKPEFRLPAMVPGSVLLPIGCLIAGWTSEAHVHWIAPDIGIALVGAGINLSFQCIQACIIDCFALHAASGFGFPLFAPAIYTTLGFGKGDTILAVVAIIVGCPAPWIFWHYGEQIRNSSRYARR